MWHHEVHQPSTSKLQSCHLQCIFNNNNNNNIYFKTTVFSISILRLHELRIYTHTNDRSVSNENSLPVCINSWSSICWQLGLLVGSPCSSFWIRFFAGAEIREGMWYSFFFIRRYVSFNVWVSNGGLPHNRVYRIQPIDHTSTCQ